MNISVPPLTEEHLFHHDDFSANNTIDDIYNELFVTKKIPAEKLKLCMWHHVEGITGTTVYLITGKVAFYDPEGKSKIVIMKIKMNKYEQYKLYNPVITVSEGYIAFQEQEFYFLNESDWQVTCQSLGLAHPDVLTKLKSTSNNQMLSSLIVPLSIHSLSYQKFPMPRSFKKWCHENNLTYPTLHDM